MRLFKKLAVAATVSVMTFGMSTMAFANISANDISANSVVTRAVAAAKENVTSTNGWVADGSTWYYYVDGKAVTGWKKISSKWYYFGTEGKMATGWNKISGKWYYFNGSGVMAAGWQKLSGSWYYFNTSGVMTTGWQKLSNNWYYFNTSGKMLTGWQKLSGSWYYFNTSGVMQKSKWVGNCYLNSNGVMATSEWIDGKYYVGENGNWVKDGYSGTDTAQADEEALYDSLFDINSTVKIELNISDEQLKLMEADYKADDEDTYRKVNMTITVNGKTYELYEVGARLKGNTSRTDLYNNDDLDDRNMVHFKLKFTETFDGDEYGDDAKVWSSDDVRKARKKRTFATLEGLELKWNRNLDETYVANTYVNQMYRAFGVYAQNTSLSQVEFGGYNYGVYTMYEPVDEIYLERYFGEASADGDLYKCQWGVKNGNTNDWMGASYTTNNLTSIGVETDGMRYTYVLKTNKKKSDNSSLTNMITALNSDTSAATFAKYVDADNFVMYAAVAYFAGNPDDLRNNYNNHYVYFNNSNGLAYIIPYDNDRVFGMTTSSKNMSAYSPTTSSAALQGTQKCPLYKNSIVGTSNNYSTEYAAALAKIYNSGWLDYSNYLKYYNKAKAHYSSVAVPASNVKALVADEGKTYENSLLAFSEGNGKIGSQGGYKTVSDYLAAIKATYVANK